MRSAPSACTASCCPYNYTSNESLNDAAATAEALGIRYDIMPINAHGRGIEQGPGKDVRRHHARRHRGEFAVAGARHAAHGHLQQVRGDGADHRQQVRGVGRLRHALWRHERRLQSDQGPLQGPGLCAGALPQSRAAEELSRARRHRRSGERADQGADRGAQAEPARSGHAAALRGARRHSQLPGRKGDAARRDRGARACARDGEEDRAHALSRRVQAAAGRARA